MTSLAKKLFHKIFRLKCVTIICDVPPEMRYSKHTRFLLEVRCNPLMQQVATYRERVSTIAESPMQGELEGNLDRLITVRVMTLNLLLNGDIDTAVSWGVEIPRHQWLFDYLAQMVLTGIQIYWTEETKESLGGSGGGQEDAAKRYFGVCDARLICLIDFVLDELTRQDRAKIMSLTLVDLHAGDLAPKLVDKEALAAFLWQQHLCFFYWQQQLRFFFLQQPLRFFWQQQLCFYCAQRSTDVDIRVCDFRRNFFYGWIGCRLVITPLTNRCYTALAMGLRCFLGGAPAAPAGTDKEGSSRSARALALPCYLFNYSDRIKYHRMAHAFRELQRTVEWGCFDEINRIPIEVLSVVATVVKCIQDAIVACSVPAYTGAKNQIVSARTPPVKVGVFELMGNIVTLIPTCGFCITMSPGYSGRKGFPNNVKSLFLSWALVGPNLKITCDNMLIPGGFQKVRTLAISFNPLGEMCSGRLLCSSGSCVTSITPLCSSAHQAVTQASYGRFGLSHLCCCTVVWGSSPCL